MPTPSAPPITDSALSGMPAADSANSSPTSSSNARVALDAILRAEISLPIAPRISRASMVADSHSISSITPTALSAPCSSASSDRSTPPTRQCSASSSATSSGSNPVSHSTRPIHTTQETVRSSRRTSIESGNATCSTRTLTRMISRLARIGMASGRIVTGSTPCSAQRASTAPSSANSGHNTPSKMRWPNQMLSRGRAPPRIPRTTR